MDRLTKQAGDGFSIDCEKCPKRGQCNDSTDCVEVISNRLARYEEAEESGRLFNFPCKVGDTVMAYIGSPTVILSECVISEIQIHKDWNEPLFTALCYEKAEYENFWLSDFGKEVFTLDQYWTMLKATRNGGKRKCSLR